MYVGNDFSPQNPTEINTHDFDFVRDLGVGETISTTEWNCIIHPKSDVADVGASSRIVGAATISGTKSIQRIGNLIPGALYIVEGIVVTNQSNTISYWAHIRGLAKGSG